ncbi:LmbE family protein [bacterium]|nr:LmbE family protein [bacterium]
MTKVYEQIDPMLNKLKYLIAGVMLWANMAGAQNLSEVSSSEILHEIKGLKSVGSVLYLAAHPDDENTKVISYLAQGMQLETSYLALTRGDGGQNLIGTEIGTALGVLRTQELLMARSVDHGHQYFSRAIDFGYSKNPEETFNMWQREEVLKDVVWVIRQTRPDLIITRFPPDERAGHGHHTASAMLAIEAIKAANDPNFKFGDARDNKLKPWKVHRVVWNTSIWWYERMGIEIDESKLYKLDVGTYEALLGQSFNSIASRARSMHRSQGFGDLIDRGSYPEYFEHLAGDSAKKDIFEDYDFTWYRFGNFNLAQKATNLIEKIVGEYNPAKPEQSLPDLVKLKQLIDDVNDPKWQKNLNERVDLIIAQCAGLWCEVIVNQYYACQDDEVTFTLNAIKRNDCTVKTKFVDFGEFTYHIEEPTELYPNNLTEVVSRTVKIDMTDYGYTEPYWLKAPPHDGLFTIENAELIGLPEKRPFQNAHALFEVNGCNISVTVPISYKWEDRARGELRRPFEIRPKVSLNFDEPVLVASAGSKVKLALNVLINTNNVIGNLQLNLPTGWTASPKELFVEGRYRGEVIPVVFEITPSSKAVSGVIGAQFFEEGNVYNKGLVSIEHEHIPAQVMLPDAQCKLVYMNVNLSPQKIGYLMGAGDEVPVALAQLGYTVEMLDPENISLNILKQYKTIVVGVRAYNTIENIRNIHGILMQFVEAGGKVITQYNTSSGLKSEIVGPYDLKPDRDRITDEHAKLTILQPTHAIFNTPNKITQDDFAGWVQERGLYFPSSFDSHYTALLSGHDPGEEDLKGMLLVTNYGKGKFVYTGISFFRELPAGVPGAYRLFVNLIEF